MSEHERAVFGARVQLARDVARRVDRDGDAAGAQWLEFYGRLLQRLHGDLVRSREVAALARSRPALRLVEDEQPKPVDELGAFLTSHVPTAGGR